ncbi:MAG: AAA family ATPase, partial [Anaerolineales bacterium]|nr:AAA family ATPase [Anaerolineales bacterium]
MDAEALLLQEEALPLEDLTDIARNYQGEFLPGFYEDWIGVERDRLQSAYHKKMNLLVDTLIQAEEWDQALEWSEQWIRLGHSPESAFRAMMIAYAGLGDQGMVRATYERCEESLERELGLQASPEMRRLFDQLSGQESVDDLVSQAHVREFVIRRPSFLDEAEPRQIERPVFVVRESELAQLDSHLESMLTNQGRVIFVTGEAGSGKTALLNEFTRRALEEHAELVVASGNCNAYTGIGNPYLPLREILGMLTGDVEARLEAEAITRNHARRLWDTLPLTVRALVESGPDLIDTFIPGAALVQRAMVCAPEGADWLRRLKEAVERQGVSLFIPSPQQSDFFEQYTRVLRSLSREVPLVLMLDDLQWADAGSVGLLFHLGRQLAGSPILIVGAYRQEEVAMGREGARHPLEPVVYEFQREYGAISVNLSQADRWEFVEAFLDCEPNRLPPFREMLHRQTQGHPLFTIELLRGLQERGDLVQDKNGQWIEGPMLDWETMPARVEAVIGERIGRLTQPLQATLRVASVEGEVFTAEMLARVMEMDDKQILADLSGELDRKHRLIRAKSIQRSNGQLLSSYRFRHILFQKYLYGSLDEVEKVHLHEQVGTVLEGLYAAQEEIPVVALQLARHFEEA